MVLIAVEFDVPRWSPTEARRWLKDNDIRYKGSVVATKYSLRYNMDVGMHRLRTFGSKRTNRGIRFIFGFM